ncbi:MAG: nucleotidyltransferase domain-containing protein [Candidatus Parvarchaeota archaeon]|jgi:hypothetical protein|nr:nucleotidyltransferase domain-containing protein [Candidatus Parvarchaeota archaeon]
MDTVVKTVLVSSKGQIAIPKEIREDIKIKNGDTLLLIEHADEIILKKASRLYIPTILEIKSQVVPTLKHYGVKKAAIFGSFARREATVNSDVDLLVDLPDNISAFTLVDLKEELEEKLDRSVDLVTYDTVNPLIKDSILKEKVELL